MTNVAEALHYGRITDGVLVDVYPGLVAAAHSNTDRFAAQEWRHLRRAGVSIIGEATQILMAAELTIDLETFESRSTE